MAIYRKIGSFFACFLIVLILNFEAQAREKINVLAYAFPPFVNEDLVTGLTPELIDLLNSAQENYEFILKPTSPKRRYIVLERNDADMMFFEMGAWGWNEKQIPIETTRVLMTGGEVYIALKKEGRDQSFFKDLSSKKIGAFFGYHYGFADFNSNAKWLRKRFNIILNQSHERNIDLVNRGAVDIGVVTLSFIEQYFQVNPEIRHQFLISEKFDQVYELPILISPNSPVSVEIMEFLLDQLKASGKLQKLFDDLGLSRALTY